MGLLAAKKNRYHSVVFNERNIGEYASSAEGIRSFGLLKELVAHILLATLAGVSIILSSIITRKKAANSDERTYGRDTVRR